MNRRFFACGAFFACAQVGALSAQSPPTALSGDRFLLDGREIRLADILAPSENGPRGSAEPFAREATAVLADLLASGAITIEDVAPSDRWSRRVVRAMVRSGETENRSITEELVAAGAVRVRPETDDEGFVQRLLEAEAIARDARRGLWFDWRYRIHAADDANHAVGAFDIVEGVVFGATARGGRVYLNFGEDYRSDFTVTAKSSLARKWTKQGLDLVALNKARVRVRGYVAWINGPSIELLNPGQIEVLERAPTDAAED